jgi:hypothetical protein
VPSRSDALPLSAGELAGATHQELLRHRDALEEAFDTVPASLPVGRQVLHAQGLGHDLFDRHPRIE